MRFLWLIFIAVALNRLCSLLPSGIYFDPFPLYDMQINMQSYYFFITNHLAIILIWFSISKLQDQYSKIFFNFTIIEILSLVDFLLIYEHWIFKIGNYGVEFTDFKILLYAFFIVTWRKTK